MTVYCDAPCDAAQNSIGSSAGCSSLVLDWDAIRASQAGAQAAIKAREEQQKKHCPHPHPSLHCGPHGKITLNDVLTHEECDRLYRLWKRYHDDLTWPWYKKKPEFWDEDFVTYKEVCQRVVDAISEAFSRDLILDQATISATNHIGHPPHCDNVQFDSVWWNGKRIRPKDELVASREGAYPHWRTEKTAYRNYGSTIALVDPEGYEGGEVQFFDKWGDKDPIATHKCKRGSGVAFCGCEQNIHAVTGVRQGFRLVLLVWTRPPGVFVPPEQRSTCYFRPGTGYGVWLTTADMKKREVVQTEKEEDLDDDDLQEEITCDCPLCGPEKTKLSWKQCLKCHPKTPPTSVGSSPRDDETLSEESSGGNRQEASQSRKGGTLNSWAAGKDASLVESEQKVSHIPWDLNKKAMKQCAGPCNRVELLRVISDSEVTKLWEIWKWYKDDLSWPWYDEKPEFWTQDFCDLHCIAQKVVDAMAREYGIQLQVDQATISCTNKLGHPPHCDNAQLDSVWWHGRQVKKHDELTAARSGAQILWTPAKTAHRTHGASIALANPDDYWGGELEFYEKWGDQEPCAKHKFSVGDGVAFCGCPKCIHAVIGVTWGKRLQFLVWGRPKDVACPKQQASVCYFRPGTGPSVWLTSADIEQFGEKGYDGKLSSFSDDAHYGAPCCT